jgi:hypothetical protein
MWRGGRAAAVRLALAACLLAAATAATARMPGAASSRPQLGADRGPGPYAARAVGAPLAGAGRRGGPPAARRRGRQARAGSRSPAAAARLTRARGRVTPAPPCAPPVLLPHPTPRAAPPRPRPRRLPAPGRRLGPASSAPGAGPHPRPARRALTAAVDAAPPPGPGAPAQQPLGGANELLAPTSQLYTICSGEPALVTGVSGRVTLSSTKGARAAGPAPSLTPCLLTALRSWQLYLRRRRPLAWSHSLPPALPPPAPAGRRRVPMAAVALARAPDRPRP